MASHGHPAHGQNDGLRPYMLCLRLPKHFSLFLGGDWVLVLSLGAGTGGHPYGTFAAPSNKCKQHVKYMFVELLTLACI